MTTTKKPRKRGELAALVAREMKRNPNITPRELADLVGTSRENARLSIKRYQRDHADELAVSEGSALGRLMGPGIAKATGMTSDERRFIAAAQLIGLARAEELLRAERVRINAEVKAS